MVQGLLLACAVFALSACTTPGTYEGVRQGELQRCETLPESERARCRERNQDDYDTYERKREELKKQQ